MIDYRNTGGTWSGFTERDNFAVRWTGYVKIDTPGQYEWCAGSDDGSKLIIDDGLTVNNDGLHGMRSRCGSMQTVAGNTKMEAQFFERGGGAGMELSYSGADTSRRRKSVPASQFFFDGKVPATTTPPPPTAPPPPPSKLVPGLKEEVWYKKYGMSRLPTSWSSPSETRAAAMIDYRNTGGTWSGFTERDNFAVRWTGYVKIDTPGQYEWCTGSDDGSKLIIDDGLTVNNDGLHGMRTKCSKLSVAAGYHKMEAQFFERGGHAGMKVSYSGADTSNSRNSVPASQLFFDGKVPTTTTPPPPPPGTCDFESMGSLECNKWKNVGGDKFDWTRKSGRTPSSSTGPSKAKSGNYYFFIETSSPRRTGDEAILQSNQLTTGPAGKLEFYYHMYGRDIGSLEVKVMDGPQGQSVWKKSGQQTGNSNAAWTWATVPLGQLAGKSIRVQFVGTKGKSWAGDIAIDDVFLTAGPPPTTTTKVPTTTTTKAPTTTTTKAPTTTTDGISGPVSGDDDGGMGDWDLN